MPFPEPFSMWICPCAPSCVTVAVGALVGPEVADVPSGRSTVTFTVSDAAYHSCRTT